MAFDLSWMAWTWHTALFFIAIAALIAMMGAWEWFSPGGAPRDGILRLTTTRGDRLFISLLGSAYIHLAWLGLASGPLWWALLISGVYALAVFRFV
jgi:predicted small integral membrane protein